MFKHSKTVLWIIAITIVFILFQSCQKENKITVQPSFKAEYLSGDYMKLWKRVSGKINGQTVTDSFYFDDQFLFGKGSEGMLVFGELDQPGYNSAKTDIFEWTIKSDSLILKNYTSYGHPAGVDKIFKILALNDSQAVLSDYEPSTKITSEWSYVPAVSKDSKPSLTNKFLTNGNVKVWCYASSTLDGKKYEFDSSKADDMLFFSTSGFGYYLYGEIDPYSGDTINNDLIKWQFIDNDSKIYISQYRNPYLYNDDTKIIKLTDDTLILEPMKKFENGILRVTFIPYFKKYPPKVFVL
ncbi:MAG: hypothetical protein ABSG15_08245 [FCB group bacterium]|jgi:hypothetical protein